MSLPRLILASASPRRAELLRELGRPFEIIPSEAAESVSEQLTAVELCQLNAYRKARAVAKRLPDCLVLGSDTVVALGPTLLGKPRDLPEAARMLGQLQGKTHMVVTGVCLLYLRRHRQKIFSDRTMVTLRPLSEEAIRAYHERVHPLDKAGAYAIQERGDEIVESISGSFANVVGLPLERLREELAAFESAIREISSPKEPGVATTRPKTV